MNGDFSVYEYDDVCCGKLRVCFIDGKPWFFVDDVFALCERLRLGISAQGIGCVGDTNKRFAHYVEDVCLVNEGGMTELFEGSLWNMPSGYWKRVKEIIIPEICKLRKAELGNRKDENTNLGQNARKLDGVVELLEEAQNDIGYMTQRVQRYIFGTKA